jgi:hypothetical protein
VQNLLYFRPERHANRWNRSPPSATWKRKNKIKNFLEFLMQNFLYTSNKKVVEPFPSFRNVEEKKQNKKLSRVFNAKFFVHIK